jgi:hypothetical protein
MRIHLTLVRCKILKVFKPCNINLVECKELRFLRISGEHNEPLRSGAEWGLIIGERYYEYY